MSKRVSQKKSARVVREQLARERRRQRTMWTSVIAVLVLLIAGGIGWAVYASQHKSSFTTPPSAVADGTGFAVGSGSATVDI
jgi:cytoskeletal protein RodZ